MGTSKLVISPQKKAETPIQAMQGALVPPKTTRPGGPPPVLLVGAIRGPSQQNEQKEADPAVVNGNHQELLESQSKPGIEIVVIPEPCFKN